MHSKQKTQKTLTHLFVHQARLTRHKARTLATQLTPFIGSEGAAIRWIPMDESIQEQFEALEVI